MISTLPPLLNLDEYQPATLWNAIYRDYQERIYCHLLHLVGPDLADDLTQETFLRAGKALHHMSGALQVSPWLYRIATNLAYDTFRRRQLKTWQSIDAWEEERLAEFPEVQIEDPQERIVERIAVQGAVQVVLERLPETYRAALLLNVFKGYNGPKIAETLGFSPRGGKMFLSRARTRFREMYEELSREDHYAGTY